MRLVAILLVCLCSGNLQATEVLVITGVYTGKNLYVQNPILEDNRNFSTQEVYVNEDLVLSKPMASAFIVDLSHLSMQQEVEVRIVHQENFPPKIINAYALGVVAVTDTQEFQPIKDVFLWTKADRDMVRWLLSDSQGGIFELQRAAQEGWQTVESMTAYNQDEENVFKLRVAHQKGLNTYRIKLINQQGYVAYSEPIHYKSN